MKIEKLGLEEGDKVLYNDRKQPLEVEKVDGEKVLVKGSGGGEYEIYEADDTEDLLVCSRGKRRYSSYCRNLRKVGEWKQDEDRWFHTDGSSIKLEENEVGYWVIKSNDIKVEKEIDLPKYGYNDREEAENDLMKVLDRYPEGFKD